MDREELLLKLGKHIKQLRVSKGLTQVELGANVGKDYQSIQRLEYGKINPSYLYLLDIAKGLEVPISELVEL